MYDYTKYQNTVTMAAVTAGWIYWDYSHDMVFGGYETTTTDEHVTYHYMDKGLWFKNGYSASINLGSVTVSQEYTVYFCFYLNSFTAGAYLV